MSVRRSTELNASGHQLPNFESSHNIILCLFSRLICCHNSPFVRIPTSKQVLEESSLLWLSDDTGFCIFYRGKDLVSCLLDYQVRMDVRSRVAARIWLLHTFFSFHDHLIPHSLI